MHISSPTTPASCGAVDNTATADASNDDPVSANTAVVVLCPRVNVVKTPDEGIVSAGTAIGSTITVANDGPGTASGVTLVDTLPVRDGLVWSESPDVAACSITAGVLSCDFGNLNPGERRTVHLVSPTTAASCGTISNTATADSTSRDPVSRRCSTELPSRSAPT